ncbi:hypothetical protein [Pseudobacteriovorax antillogorgiicola]|nr:hypothetical protein [Pseudobacteriovorax antillogorgiicola]
MAFRRNILLFALTLLWQGQTTKHPKVAEVEAHLSQKTIDFVKNRFPGVPVLVNLTVTPLRRSQSELNSVLGQNELPYYSMTGVQIKDEWDDPNKGVHDLLPRIQRVAIRITMPQYVSDEELFELRESLFSNLNIIPGRDTIEFNRKNWQKRSIISWELVALILSSLLILSIGGMIVARIIGGKIESGLSKSSGKQEAPPPPVPQPQLNNQQAPAANKSGSGQMSSGMQFNDTMKIAEKLEETLRRIEKDDAFPTLDDMIDFEDLAQKDPKFLGTIIQEMSKDLQEKIFQRGTSPKWLETFFEQAPLDIEHYNFALKLTYRKRSPEHILWDELLIALWRLGDGLKEIVKGMEQRDALGILAWMPTTVSVPTARESFPGGWGILLKHDFKPPPMKPEQIQPILDRCLELKPYFDLGMLDQYQHERGLLKFLRVCTLDEERDIYKASKPDASIHVLRPPFYPIFDAEDEDLEKLANAVSAQNWGVALFNINRSLRSGITKHLSKAKNYILIETLKTCDHDGIAIEEVWQMRERVAVTFKQLIIDNKVIETGSDGKPQEGDVDGPKVA